MADEKPSTNSSGIQIATGDELPRGRYSNTMLVSHSAEEFMVGWLTENSNKDENRFGWVRVVENDAPAFH